MARETKAQRRDRETAAYQRAWATAQRPRFAAMSDDDLLAERSRIFDRLHTAEAVGEVRLKLWAEYECIVRLQRERNGAA